MTGNDESAQETARVRSLSAAPVMIVGAPRSGTTWVQRLLLADARCCGGQESHFFATFGRVLHDFDRKAGLERPHGLACYWKRDDLVAEIARLWRRTVAGLVATAPQATRLVEKTPDHALWLATIAEVVPGARIVHVVRDSRAVCASLLAAGRAAWGRSWAPQSLDAALEVWIRHVDAVEAFAADDARCRVHRLHYEALHAAPAETLATLWAFAELEADGAELASIARACAIDAERANAGGFVGTGEVAGTVAEPEGFRRAGSADGWREELTRREERTVWRATAERMTALGYDRDGWRPRD